MSTYLACWVIAPDDFGYASETTEKGVPVSRKRVVSVRHLFNLSL